jgi:hypothetical protein
MYSSGVVFRVLICLILVPPAWARHTLTSQEQKTLSAWLTRHPIYRVATEADCGCAEDIKQMKIGYGENWPPVQDYHPYVATGDFNSDGVSDFAIVVINRSRSSQNFVLLIFNGPFGSKVAQPAFIMYGLDLRGQGLFFGPPRPKPYRLVLGHFESDNTVILVPRGHTYKLEAAEGG